MKTRPWNIYIDTNVWCSPFDKLPYHSEVVDFFKTIVKNNDKWKIFTSELVLTEISMTKEPKLTQIKKLLEKVAPAQLSFEDKIQDLAKEYVKGRVVKEKSFRDALHIAYATFYEMDYLISLNFDDINNITTIKKIQLMNYSLGYSRPLQICSPLEVK
ncbi:MAG: PIN domain-containing protein [Pseudomonadota bacterium]